MLGPFLFTQYTVPIGAICRRHGVKYQLYADDTQVYVSFSIANEEDREMPWIKSRPVSRKYEHGCSHIDLSSMMTKLNLLFLLHPKVNIDGVRIGDCDIEPNPCARNIGVYFDSSMNINQQITKLCKI